MKTKEYIQQAEDFLKACNTTITIEFLKNDYHFEGDGDKRDIYLITLKRGQRKFSFNFGQSLNNSGFFYTKGVQKIQLDRKLLLLPVDNFGNFIKNKLDWGFLNNGKSDIVKLPTIPNSYDILSYLTKNDPETFQDFCDNFCYDIDSRNAKKTYKAVVKEWNNTCKLFNEDEIKLLQEIQ